MSRIVRAFAILFMSLSVLLLGVSIYKIYMSVPHLKTRVPHTHYHGYALNHRAIERARAFTVLISNEGLGGCYRGTGILLDPIHVLTCAHMVGSPDDDIWIFPYSKGIVVKGKPVFVDKSVDLAILALDKPVHVAHYASFQLNHYDGEPLTIIGNTLGSMRWFVSFGIISGEWQGFLLTDGVLYGGNSGGPWINEKGEVLALTDWTLAYHDTESGIHGGIPAKTIWEFIAEWKSPVMGLFQQLLGSK